MNGWGLYILQVVPTQQPDERGLRFNGTVNTVVGSMVLVTNFIVYSTFRMLVGLGNISFNKWKGLLESFIHTQ